MPSPEQIANMRRQLAADADKAGMTVPDFVEHLKKQATEQQAKMREQHPGGPMQEPTQQGVPQPILPGPPNPVAVKLAKFLKGQQLKSRISILNGERKEMFRGKYPTTGLWGAARLTLPFQSRER